MLFSEHVKIIQFDRTRRAYGFFTEESTTPETLFQSFLSIRYLMGLYVLVVVLQSSP